MRHRCGLLTAGCLLVLLTAAPVLADDWVELKNCRLAENESNDGDSFVVECPEVYRGERQNRFRLFYVDAAETDANSDFKRDRLAEQAAYWESDDSDFAMQMGLRAAQTVAKILRGGFTVYTRGDYAPSMGRPRYYAVIKVNGRWLDEILAEEGLVRIYGKGANLPDGTHANTHRARLRQLERDAKAARRNGWRNAADEPEPAQEAAAFEPHDARTVCATWIYSIKTGSKVTALPAATIVTVTALAGPDRFRVRFEQNGKVYEGLCERKNLEP